MAKSLLFTLLATILFIQKTQAQIGCYTPIITGQSSACIGSVVEYRIAPGPMNFNWSVSSGGTVVSIGPIGPIPPFIATVQWNNSGPQTVTASCGSFSETFNVNVSTTMVPAAPASITGSSNLCLNSSSTYTVPLSSGLSYFWEIIQYGSVVNNQTSIATNNSFDITWITGGTYQINAYYSNGDCLSPAKSISVVVQQIPVLQLYTGTSHCVGGTTTFLAFNGTSSDTFTWSIDGGEQITNSGNSAQP